MISEIKISTAQLTHLLLKPEGPFLDFKGKDIAPAKLTKALSAFANADGGELFVGIATNTEKTQHSWEGFTNQEEANGLIQCFENFFPLGQDTSYEFLVCDGHKGLILRAEIRKSGNIRKSSDGTVYLRRGAQNHKVEGEEALSRLRLNKGIKTFENEIVRLAISVSSDQKVGK